MSLSVADATKGVHLSRPRAMTSMRSSGATSVVTDPFQKLKHGRTMSELSVTQTERLNRQLPRQKNQSQAIEGELRGKRSASLSQSGNSSTDPSNDSVSTRVCGNGSELDSELGSRTLRNMPASIPLSTQINNDSEDEISAETLDAAQDEGSTRPNSIFTSVSLEELVDRLLSPLMSKSDARFISIFLCLYRRFAAPSDLVSAIIYRFRTVSQSQEAYILRVTSQLRYLGVLAQWLSGYPGDFAHPLTRSITTQFLSGLASTHIFAAARKEMTTHLNVLVEDDDTEWACSDSGRSKASEMETSPGVSSLARAIPPQIVVSMKQDKLSGRDVSDPSKQRAGQHSATSSITSSAGRSDSQSSASLQTLLDSTERARRQARFLAPIPRTFLGKAQWHRLMEIPEDDIARELTRIDWIMYSSIRPRDLVRHVTLSAEDRSLCKGLENIDRMINHFNHVAFWVANLILLRDKPKHRALILERFMRIAWVS